MNAELYSEINGAGRDVVLLHGWGMHGGLWGQFKSLLAENIKTHTLDLPGFGFSREMESDFSLKALTYTVEAYIKNIKKPVSIIAWSLGGLIALNILQRKKIRLEKLVLIASTPSFTIKRGWESAMEQSVFDGFSNDLKQDYIKTLKRFLLLQTRGSELARDELRELNQQLNSRGEPNIKALENGLAILRDTDLRNDDKNTIAAMIILGEKDTLIPVSVKSEFKKTFPNSEVVIVEKTGHTPFISQPEYCAEKIKNFINE